jgi:ATP-dependent RNA helicase DDX49/DBP8
VCVVLGGLDMMKQAVELSRRPHIVIATPGRLADHINSSALVTLDRIRFLGVLRVSGSCGPL